MRSNAPCSADPETFLSEVTTDIRLSKRICERCPLRVTCLEQTLELEDQLGHTIKGTAGATTQQERVEIHARRAA
jgi:hypothetical protein